MSGAYPKHTAAKVIEAARKCYGIKMATARALGVNRTTVESYIKRWPSVRKAFIEARDICLDDAESVLYKKAITEEETSSLHFLLRTVGKSRGYGDSQALDISGKLKIKTSIPTFDDGDKRKIALFLHKIGALEVDD